MCASFLKNVTFLSCRDYLSQVRNRKICIYKSVYIDIYVCDFIDHTPHSTHPPTNQAGFQDYPVVYNALKTQLAALYTNTYTKIHTPAVFYVCGSDNYQMHVRNSEISNVIVVQRQNDSKLSNTTNTVFSAPPANEPERHFSSTNVRKELYTATRKKVVTYMGPAAAKLMYALVLWSHRTCKTVACF